MYSLRIAEGRTIRIGINNGIEFTIRRERGSIFIVDSPREVRIRLIPKTKKEISNGSC